MPLYLEFVLCAHDSVSGQVRKAFLFYFLSKIIYEHGIFLIDLFDAIMNMNYPNSITLLEKH